MHKRTIIYLLGWVLIIEGMSMQLSTLVGLYYGEGDYIYFLIIGLALAALGAVTVLLKPKGKIVMYLRDGFAATALSWCLLSAAGCLPFVFSGAIPNFADALFEMVSGFTTTGATVVPKVEELSNCMNFWRCFSNWLGGMGVLVFLLALIPKLGISQNINIMKAESPGPIVAKSMPKIRNYAAFLYIIYIGLTILEFLFLILGGMGGFDAVNTCFATAGTGGFGIRNNNIAAYDSYYLQTVIAVFMLLFGINFTFYILLITKKFSQAIKIHEVFVYLAIVAVCTGVIALNISSVYSDPYEAFHQSFFYVSSIITTTGFGITDVNMWPELAKTIIVIITFIGACAGSTGGGFKVSRVIILFKEVKKEISLIVHPRNVKAVSVGGKIVKHGTLRSVSTFLVVYIGIFALSMIIVAGDNFDFTTTFTSVAATLNNTGPGLGDVGTVGNYSAFSTISKLVLSFDMLAGRLELFPLLILFSPSAWKKS
ncbi:MAG: TrkH family potassium uptake protein [Ruminococcus sp.]